MIGFSFIELLTLLFLGGSPLGLPLSLPPLPEDPAMAQIAPAECLWYLSWSGCAKPDPSSSNHTEQLLAEQEVQRFLTELEIRLREAIKRGAPQGPQAAQAAVLAEEGPNLLKLVVTRPAAFFLESVTVAPQKIAVKGGAVISAGDQAESTKRSIDRLADALGLKTAPQRGKPGELTLSLPPDAPPVELRWHNSYLVVGIGEGACDQIIKRFGGSSPQWLTKIRKDLPVERPASVHYLNIRQALAAAAPVFGQQGFKFGSTLGLDGVSHYAGVSGLDRRAAVTRSQLVLDREPRGLFALLKQAPLAASDLARVPKDATLAMVARFDAAKALAGFVELVGQLNPAAEQQLKSELAAAEKHLGFKISEDLLQSLGDTWSIYNSPGEGGLVFTGLTAVVPVKDQRRLAAAHDKLLAAFRALSDEMQRLRSDGNGRGRRPQGVVIADFKFGQHTVYFLNFIGAEAPFAPAWCITDNELIVSLFPQMIKARLTRGAAAGSLADLPEVAALFQRDAKPSAVFYQDTKSIARLVYPLAHLAASFITSQLQRERVDLDISLLPSMAAIEPHLMSGVNAVYHDSDGIRWESSQTMPGAGPAPLVVAALGVFGLRTAAIRRADFNTESDVSPADTVLFNLEDITPAGAQLNASKNNLKQIGLALHNFHDTHRRLPVADGSGVDGKPKLSWRVHILPFLEQQALFNEFKLDEPWDSEHNKKLIAKMPKVYAAPGGKMAEKHLTNYLAIRAKDAMFPAGKAIRFADVVDGLSNTAMVLEVSDDRAVIWTKPDDFEPDREDPLKGVAGLRNGKFLVLMGDAAVHAPKATLSKETIQALFTRAGGEVADFRN